MRGSLLLYIWIALVCLLDCSESKKRIIGPCILVEEEPGDCPDPDYIKVYLFTRKNKEEGQYVAFTETTDNFTASHFNPLHPNTLIIHGFNSDMNLYALVDVRTAYLQQGEHNVWAVAYEKLAQGSSLCYPFAVHNIRHVGHCLAQLIMALRRHKSADIHVMGFSLGAHVPNYIAEKLGSDKLNRITGLDPAGPLFTARNERNRLDPSDASFVQVVHTNGLIQGIIERCGHIDFYMNGGVSQPGCLDKSNPFNCDHHRAVDYFAESIQTKVGFLGWLCEDYMNYLKGECQPKMDLVPMGDHCLAGSKGFYVTYTASEMPFALGNWTGKMYQKRAPKISFTKMPKMTGFIIDDQKKILLSNNTRTMEQRRAPKMNVSKMQKTITNKSTLNEQNLQFLQRIFPDFV